MEANSPFRSEVRLYHSSSRFKQHMATAEEDNTELETLVEDMPEDPNGIRAQLRQWQELHGHEDLMPELPIKDQIDEDGGQDAVFNNLTRLPDEESINRHAKQEAEEQEALAYFSGGGREGFDGGARDSSRFVRPGDLVEIEFPNSERESFIAVFLRKSGASDMGQFFTMTGRWMHLNTRVVPYSIPGWIDPKELEPLIEHLPDINSFQDIDAVAAKSYTEDLSIPRAASAPIVRKLVAFYDEAQEVYRRHASALDDAHNILAHETDLRYGSLTSAATALLKIPADKLPLAALFTVRKALANGGFAFNVDRRSHRVTGYMQIRSKEQVRMVEQVRNWIRHWQDDLAMRAVMDEQQSQRHKPGKGARILYSFIEKAQAIIAQQRENRSPTESFNVGPSKTRIPITEDTGCMRIEVAQQFTDEEQEVVRFIESWCCSRMFIGLPRIESLPPLILNATGLYKTREDGKDYKLGMPVGFLFLQELGVLMPHENRVRFDQHLLLPSSQHSKPLQNLMTSLLKMRDNHNLRDTMAHLRHDWKDLPVYCIDSASAQEIDDGISIEKAGVDKKGRPIHWLHMHIANPTAFFSRDHPLAKMARHMGETIYMPERTYMMLPRWATQRHFSLAPHKPCLTFSAKLDHDGNTLEHKITPGTIHNVIRLTYEEVSDLLGDPRKDPSTDIVFTVGGTPPPARVHTTRVPDLTYMNLGELTNISRLATQRQGIRARNDGLFFDTANPEMEVWQSWKSNGLAWDHPYRQGSRTVYGDPVIQMRTAPLKNWFATRRGDADRLVSECMLLCSEIAAKFCAERKIPAIYRGQIRDEDTPSDEKTTAAREIINSGKELPMYLGLPYLRSLGYTVLRTHPVKHNALGMDHYSKVTSPLRRYGDMILHWQIEAALRHEAETKQSLIVSPNTPANKLNRAFLPFSTQILDTIMLGLQPRESMITHAKKYSQDFWQMMLLFRKFHFDEDGKLFDHPCFGGKDTLRFFVQNAGPAWYVGVSLEIAVQMIMERNDKNGFEEGLPGDIWEVRISHINVYFRQVVVEPIRLVERNGF